MTVRIGLILPTSTPDPARPIIGDVRAAARLAERIGVESVWATDHLIASAPILETTVVLATAAAVTERILVGYNVMLPALRGVAWAAKQIASLQLVSGNRVLLGVGTGNPAHGDIGWRAAGASFEARGKLTDEALAALPGLVEGRPTTLADGLEVTLSPGAPMPPVLVAGTGNRVRRRAAAHGDGWIPIAPDLTRLPAEIARLGELAAEFGRPAPTVTVVAPALSDDPRRAAEQLTEYGAAGVERVILRSSGPDWERNYAFAADVVAAR
ncbi:LLM class flavin-dependent oxidoreductase [Nocardia arthritidis]|uniref:LLM class flavin-dependent oxidoreductase n=1 Tax=Nocardia arthritidis TaxID=228602 RepID=A0A6G9YHI3_9NOCA|nr:LLM class flavin-dependent oxidoreductase [Nocardia arthritidis]QIS12610.1 LLM class flavin-dependent oxidoreductase [Nocardia arthritidis]